MQHAGSPPFPRHFDGKRFFNPDAPQARGFLDALRWKLTSRPEPSPGFVSDVEPSKPVAGYVSSLVTQQREHAIAVGLKAGLAIGAVTAIAGSFTPFVEWMADRVPERRMGVLGIGLLLIGFTLQSVQYWVVLLDVTVRHKSRRSKSKPFVRYGHQLWRGVPF